MKGKSQKGARILILVQFNFDRITEAQMCKNKDIRKIFIPPFILSLSPNRQEIPVKNSLLPWKCSKAIYNGKYYGSEGEEKAAGGKIDYTP